MRLIQVAVVLSLCLCLPPPVQMTHDTTTPEKSYLAKSGGGWLHSFYAYTSLSMREAMFMVSACFAVDVFFFFNPFITFSVQVMLAVCLVYYHDYSIMRDRAKKKAHEHYTKAQVRYGPGLGRAYVQLQQHATKAATHPMAIRTKQKLDTLHREHPNKMAAGLHSAGFYATLVTCRLALWMAGFLPADQQASLPINHLAVPSWSDAFVGLFLYAAYFSTRNTFGMMRHLLKAYLAGKEPDRFDAEQTMRDMRDGALRFQDEYNDFISEKKGPASMFSAQHTNDDFGVDVASLPDLHKIRVHVLLLRGQDNLMLVSSDIEKDHLDEEQTKELLDTKEVYLGQLSDMSPLNEEEECKDLSVQLTAFNKPFPNDDEKKTAVRMIVFASANSKHLLDASEKLLLADHTFWEGLKDVSQEEKQLKFVVEDWKHVFSTLLSVHKQSMTAQPVPPLATQLFMHRSRKKPMAIKRELVYASEKEQAGERKFEIHIVLRSNNRPPLCTVYDANTKQPYCEHTHEQTAYVKWAQQKDRKRTDEPCPKCQEAKDKLAEEEKRLQEHGSVLSGLS